MCKKSLLMMLLLALFAPWAAKAQKALPYSYGFENNDLNAEGWTVQKTSSSTGISTSAKHEGSYGFQFYYSEQNAYLVSPVLSGTGNGVALSFYYKESSSSYGDEQFYVGYTTDETVTDPSAFTYGNITTASLAWQLYETMLPAGTKKVAIKYVYNDALYLFLDDFTFEAPSACPKPTGLAATPNGQSATLTWTSDASSFHVAYSADGTANPDDLTYTTVTTNSYTKDNLALDADHYFWVRANCSGTDQSAWAGPVSVHIGYCVPAPTSVDNNGISNVTFGMGDYVVNNDTPKATYADYSTLVGAVPAGVESTIAITFKTGYTYNTFVWVDLDNSLSFDPDEVVCYGECASTNPTTLTLNFTIPADQTLGDFRLRIGSADSGLGSDPANANPCYTGSYGCFQDYTLRVLEAPSCLPPTGVAVSNVTGHTATISWTSDADAWQIGYSNDNFATEQYVEVTENPYTLTGLTPETAYQVRVQTNCGSGVYSIFTNPVSFTTAVACPAPTVAVNNITSSTADVTCTNTEASEFNLQLINPNVTPADTTTFANVTMPYPLTGLTQDKSYKVRVQALCGGEDGESAWSSVVTFTTAEECPEGMVCIGTGKSTNSYLPAYTYFNYSLTQQIYTAAEIGGAGAIMSIEFYSTATERTRTLDIYMVMTDKASFASTSDYIAVTASDLVYSGSVTFVQNDWTTIQLNTPFAYADDTQNVAIIVHDKTGGYVGSPSYRVFSATDMALYAYNDNYDYVPSTPGTYSNGTYTFTKTNVKNRIRLTMGEITDCDMPTNLAVSDITMESANLTWTAGGSETAWQVCINGDEDHLIDVTNNAYQLTGLTAATIYTVKVRSNCGSSQSYWTPEISFNTAICDAANQCEISYEFSVNNYTTWHSATIDVVDVETNIVLATLTYDATAPTGTVTVCDGRAIKFVYNPASPDFYNSYNVYTFTDVNNEVIFSGSGTFEPVNYVANCTVTNCRKPQGLAVNDMLVATWEAGEASAWNLQYKKTEDTEWTLVSGLEEATYTFTGLEFVSEYEVQVQADCGDETSAWTASVTFVTPACAAEDMCEITIELTDAYGDGGGQIQVVDKLTEEVLGTYTNSSASTVYTLTVCEGRILNFIYTSTDSWSYENGWVITDINGEIISEHVGCSNEASCDAPENGIFANYVMSCAITTCRRPTDLAVSEVGGHSAVLSWTENGEATEWIVAYTTDGENFIEYNATTSNPFTMTGLDPETVYGVKVRPICSDFDDKWSEMYIFATDVACPKPYDVNVTPYPFTANVEWDGFAEAYEIEWAEMPATRDPYAEEGWYYYDNGTYAGSVGLGGGEFHWGIMLPAGSFEGNTIDVVKAYDINAMVGTLAIYNDGETAPANQLSIQDMEFTGAGAWVEFNTGGVIVDPTKNVWIVFDAVDGAAYPIGTSSDDNGDANGRWVEISGTWYDLANVGVTGRANMIRAHFVSINYDELDWTTVSGVTSPYLIEDLEAETDYIVRVKALCGGEDGESLWAYANFTTPSACDAPIDLTAEDITYNAATLNWTGYQESYNLRYRRTPYVATTYFSEDFDEGLPATWTTIDNDTTTVGNWIALSEINSVYTSYTSPLTGWAHSGADAVASASFVNGVGSVATDNYLVTPQVTFNGKLRFYATSEYEDPDTYEVLLSTTGNSISDFNVTLQAMGPATYNAWDEVIIDLSDYAGQQGYIAIHHVATDKYWLVIDDFGMYDFVYEDWTNVTATENTYTATGLTHDTEYEWQVQGINPSCTETEGLTEWSEIATFTAGPIPTQTIALTAGWNYVSFNKEITLNELKAALVEAVPGTTITIQSKTDNTSYNPARNRWTGSLTWNLNQMYLIQVNADCEIALQAFPVIPSEHPITVLGGGQYTYIAFPLDESMSLTNAFAGFAVNDDVIQSKDGNSQYKRGRWMGNSLTNLEPGSGYIYQSGASTADRILVFPAVNSKATVAPTAPKKAASLTPVKFPNTITLDLNLRK